MSSRVAVPFPGSVRARGGRFPGGSPEGRWEGRAAALGWTLDGGPVACRARSYPPAPSLLELCLYILGPKFRGCGAGCVPHSVFVIE